MTIILSIAAVNDDRHWKADSLLLPRQNVEDWTINIKFGSHFLKNVDKQLLSRQESKAVFGYQKQTCIKLC